MSTLEGKAEIRYPKFPNFLYADPSYTNSMGEAARGTLANLRLTSKAHQHSADTVLFRNIDCSCTYWMTKAAAGSPLGAECSSPAERLQLLLKRGLSGPLEHTRTIGAKIYPRDHWREIEWYEMQERRLRDATELAVKQVAETLPALVQACPKLSVLDIKVDESCMGFEDGIIPDFRRKALLEAIAMALKACPDSVHSLNLDLPFAFDFDFVESLLSASGSVEWRPSSLSTVSLRFADMEQMRQEPAHMRILADQREVHENGFWRFASRFKRSQSVHFDCGNPVEYKYQWSPHENALRELELINMSTTAYQMKEVIGRNLNSLESVTLMHVGLTSGNWAEVFDMLCRIPNLVCFRQRVSGYTTEYRVAALPAEIFTSNPLTGDQISDLKSLGALERHVNSLRESKGMTLYGKDQYKWMDTKFE